MNVARPAEIAADATWTRRSGPTALPSRRWIPPNVTLLGSTPPHTTLVLTVVVVLVHALRTGAPPSASLLVGAVYWGGLNIILLCGFINRGRHGITVLPRRGRRAEPVEAGQPSAAAAG